METALWLGEVQVYTPVHKSDDQYQSLHILCSGRELFDNSINTTGADTLNTKIDTQKCINIRDYLPKQPSIRGVNSLRSPSPCIELTMDSSKVHVT